MLSIDELKYLRNLIKVSGDCGYSWKIGNMSTMVDCNKLVEKIERIIWQTSK